MRHFILSNFEQNILGAVFPYHGLVYLSPSCLSLPRGAYCTTRNFHVAYKYPSSIFSALRKADSAWHFTSIRLYRAAGVNPFQKNIIHARLVNVNLNVTGDIQISSDDLPPLHRRQRLTPEEDFLNSSTTVSNHLSELEAHNNFDVAFRLSSRHGAAYCYYWKCLLPTPDRAGNFMSASSPRPKTHTCFESLSLGDILFVP
jgi:hypothetical protein